MHAQAGLPPPAFDALRGRPAPHGSLATHHSALSGVERNLAMTVVAALVLALAQTSDKLLGS